MDALPQYQPGDSPYSGAAPVLRRWNSWVRVFLPATGMTSWVDLRSVADRRIDPVI